MESPVSITYQQKIKKLVLFVFIISVLATSCKVSLVAAYDSMVAEKIEEVNKEIDKFYLVMLETTLNEDDERIYDKYAEQYIDIQLDLKSLLQKNKRRDKNDETIKINQRIYDKWIEYKEIHKSQNELDDADIEANMMNMDNMLNTMLAAEQFKNAIK